MSPRVANGFLMFDVPGTVGAPRNSVIHGDCRDVMPTIPSGSVDFVLTDPPYLVNYRDRHGRSVANDNDPRWLKPVFREVYRVLKPGSLMVCFYGWNAVDQFMDAWRGAGFRPVGHVVLAKDYASSQRFFRHHHEQAYVLAKGRPALPSSPVPDVLAFPYTGNRFHPTQKPVQPLRTIISALTSPGDLVLDPFCGSGSTHVAASGVGRDWIGVELNAALQAATAKRMSAP